ncbi:MAG: hypothetical protein LWX56_14500 [Ignavibacteria bacterium]|nr:hypothetical protein [Ignavibacteria bacterium]
MKATLAIVVLIFALSASVFALPRFSLRTGALCSDCHVNPTGGAIRTEGGWTYGKNTLKMWNTYTSDESFEMSPKIGKNITFGFDYRTQMLVAFDSSSTRSDFHRMTGSVYFNVDLSPGIHTFARYDFIQKIWEGYGIVNIGNLYVKAGSFAPDFGLRLDDHSAYTRGGDLNVITNTQYGLPFGPKYILTGAEAGYNFKDIVQLSVSTGGDGTPTFQNEPAYITKLQVLPYTSDDFNLMTGVSFASVKRLDNNTGDKLNSQIYGGYFGAGYHSLTLLAEYDQGKDYYIQGSTVKVFMAEAALVLTKGLEGQVRYDSMTGDDPAAPATHKLSLQHVILGLNWTPVSFVEIIPQYRFHLEDPEIKNNAAVLQFHFFY